MKTTDKGNEIRVDMDGAGKRLINVLLKDKLSGEIIGAQLIKRATLARALMPTSLTPVTALNGMFVIEI